MNRRKFLTGVTILSISLLAGCTGKDQASSTPSVTSSKHEDPEGYWTCTMHPQVHKHEPGKCPICGMPLVLVKSAQKVERKEPEGIDVSNQQMQNAQVSKYTVSKQDLEIAVPASGRLLSSSEVVFQIYESDISSIKPGYEFSGSASSQPNKILVGRIARVDSLIDPSSRTARAIGTLQNSASINSESAFYGEITNTLKNQIVIPEDSVLHTGTKDLVYIFSSDNKLQPREIQMGQKGKQGYQILSGLNEGEVISSGPNFLIDSEAKIRGQ